MKPFQVEILAPAKDVAVARQAILAGADAVYIGASSHGARAAAGNSVEDIAGLVRMAHDFNVKVYVTVNTLVYDNEIESVERLVWELYRAGVDALIVQDMGLLRMNLPPIDLHASTQCDIRDAAKARFLHDVGFSRVVLARELSAEEIAAIHRETGVELEAFIHGALCVSYSGDCRASLVATGRSANRGECAQMCRLQFELTDGSGRRLAPPAHYLSLRDLNRIDDLETLINAGVTSLKIEGRLKDANYVVNAVAAYRRRVDEIIAASGGRLCRQSAGTSVTGFTPSLDKGFNRGFTSYFLNGPRKAGRMASMLTPKMTGRPVATVVKSAGKAIVVKTTETLVNGDGLGFFTPDGIFRGFRVNRVEANRIFPATAVDIKPGTRLFRNRDKAFDDMIASATLERTIQVDMTLRVAPGNRLCLDIADCRGNRVTATADIEELQTARSPQTEARARALGRLGDTIYRLGSLDDRADDLFIPASALASLRRSGIELLDHAQAATYARRHRGKENPEARAPKSVLSMHDNVANRLAREFYLSHGVTDIEPALEVKGSKDSGEVHVMTTRYCLRRELGHCLRTPQGRALPSPLFLTSPGIRLRLDFDCAACMMNVYSVKQ